MKPQCVAIEKKMQNDNSSLCQKTILIIAGQPKAGTTSLFHWLSQHPQISAGKIKELRFFLDPQYPLPSPLRFNGKNISDYLSLFVNPELPILLDASPDYIGCKTPLTLPELHNNVKVIITLRDPEERLVSAYRFFKSRGMIPSSMDFNQYIKKQFDEGVTEKTEVQYRALDHCRENHYIKIWRSAYGEKLLVVNFESIKRNPEETLNEIFQFIGVEKISISETSQRNKTKIYRSPQIYRAYNNVRRWIAIKTMNHPLIYLALRPVGIIFRKALTRNKECDDMINLSSEVKSIISKVKLS